MTTYRNTSDNKTIEDYAEFHIGMAINAYAPPVITVIGLVGNFLCLFVVMQKHIRNLTTAIYMAALAILDTIVLVLGLSQYWVILTFFPHLISKAYCHTKFIVVNCVGNCAVWTIVAMTAERFIVVMFPLKASRLCTPRKTLNIIACISVLSVVKNFHYIWTTDFTYNEESKSIICGLGVIRKGVWVEILHWFDGIFASFLPFIIVATLNACIIFVLNRKRIKSCRLKQHAGTNDNKSRTERNRRAKEIKIGGRGVTAMLVSVSVAFLILTSPLFILRLCYRFVDKTSRHMHAIYILAFHICHKLLYMNATVNFYLYFLTGRKFRRELKKRLCGGRKAVLTSYSMKTIAKETLKG